MSPFQPDAAIASTEPKAIETARQVAERLGLPCHILEGLHEHDRRGEPYGDRASFQAAVFRFFAAPEKLVFGRETADQAYQRFSQALQQVQERYPVRNPAIFTHGTVMCLYVGRAASQDPYRLWQRLGLPAFIVLSLPENEIVAIVEEV